MKFTQILEAKKKRGEKATTTRYKNLGLEGSEISRAKKKVKEIKKESDLEKRYGKDGMWAVIRGAIEPNVAKGIKKDRRK